MQKKEIKSIKMLAIITIVDIITTNATQKSIGNFTISPPDVNLAQKGDIMKKQMIKTLEEALEAMSDSAGHEIFYACHSDEYCYLSDDMRLQGSLSSKVCPAQIFDCYPEWVSVEDGHFSICGDKYPIEFDLKKIRRRVEDRLRKGDAKEVLRAAFTLGVDIL